MGATPLYNVNAQTPFGAPSVLINSTTPPTAQQASTTQKIVAQINFAQADTFVLVTHNWGLGASAVNFLDPEIFFEAVSPLSAAGTFVPNVTYDRTNTNVLRVNKVQSGGGTDFTANLTLRRPWSASQ